LTTGISLVRENAVGMQPPRTLWVPFPLGRPLGAPNNPAFQHRVIAAALDLLDCPIGPVLEDFPEDAPAVDLESAAVCPVSFSQPEPNDTWQSRLINEFTTLKPWHDLSLRRRGGRTLTSLSENSIEENLRKLGELLDAGQIQKSEFRWLKFAIEDAKAFYFEALTAQPGEYLHEELHRTLWQDTQFGSALRACHRILDSEPSTRQFAGIVAPRQAIESPTASPNSGNESVPSTHSRPLGDIT